jgi:CBS domain-containing protein
MSEENVEAVIAAFLAIQQFRLRNQSSQEAPGENTANRVDPDKLNELDRHILKESFRLARKLQQGLALDYQV